MEVAEKKIIKRQCSSSIGWHRLVVEFEDVLVYILSKLPVRTLLRFRCVCKKWCNLISSDPYFMQLHFQQSRSKPPVFLVSSIIVNEMEQGPHSLSLESIDKERNPLGRFVAQVDDVYSRLVPTNFDFVCIHDDETIRICNPSTHESITLPTGPKLAFPYEYSFVGFGYVKSTDEYKVVRFIAPNLEFIREGFVFEDAPFTMRCEVFTLGTQRRGCDSSWAWRDVGDSPYHVGDSSPAAFVRGAIHWLVRYDAMADAELYDGHMIDPDNTIIAFDVEREEFRLISHPKDCPDIRALEWGDLQLVELRELLCLSCTVGTVMSIWMFEGYCYESGNDHVSGTWVKMYNIDLNALPHIYHLGEDEYYVPRDIEGSKVLISTYLKGLGYYNLKTKSFQGFLHSRPRMPRFQFTFYVESLRSLKPFAQANVDAAETEGETNTVTEAVSSP